MRICFWGDVAGALKGSTPGGSELQISLLAKLLVKYGHEVIVIDYTILKGFTTIDGVKVIPIKGWNGGIRILRTFTHRFPQLYKTLIKQEADIYYCRIRDFRHLITYWAARKVNAKFVYALADGLDELKFSDRCKYEYFTNIGWVWWFFNILFSEIIHPVLLRKSDFVFAQHGGQKKSLLGKGIQSSIINNLIDITNLQVKNAEQSDFVCVGSLAKNKGLVKLYEIIKKTPEYTYKIVGQPRDKTGFRYYEKFKSMQNVSLLGRLDHENTLLQIMNSKALISTSSIEGFPNIFLEAWACGIPVLSLYVNPGNILIHENIGYFADGNIEKLLHFMAIVNSDETLSDRAKVYIDQNHIINDQKIEEIGALFTSIGSH